MKNRRAIVFITFIFLQIFFNSCANMNETSNRNVDAYKFLSNNDLVVLADSIVANFISSPDISDFSIKKKPKIVVGKFDAVTNENINIELLEKNIERSLINSGKVSFLNDKAKREESRSNRKNANDFKNKKDFEKYLKGLNPDYFISGIVELRVDSLSSDNMKEYKLLMQVLKTNKMKLVFNENISLFK